MFNKEVVNDNTDAERNTRAVESTIDYPHGMKLGLIMTSAYLSMFLVALVRISSMIHTITFVGYFLS
jgi:hypothetical protein